MEVSAFYIIEVLYFSVGQRAAKLGYMHCLVGQAVDFFFNSPNLIAYNCAAQLTYKDLHCLFRKIYTFHLTAHKTGRFLDRFFSLKVIPFPKHLFTMGIYLFSTTVNTYINVGLIVEILARVLNVCEIFSNRSTYWVFQ